MTLVLCYIWPFAGLLFSLYTVLNNKNRITIFIVAISFFLAYINSTKTISSDTIHYIAWYSNIDRTKPLESFFFYRGYYTIVEPLFTIISIIFNYLTLGNKIGYLFFCSFLIYFLQFYAIYIIAVKFKITNKHIITLIIMLAFINPLFIQSVHALRQMISTSFLMLAIAYKVTRGKNNWYLIGASFFTHMSAIAYLPLILLPICYRKASISRIIAIGLIVSILLIMSESIGAFLGGIDSEIMSAAGEKILSRNNELNLGLRGFYLYNIPFLIITTISLFYNKGQYQELSIYYYLYIITFIIVITNPISTEISIRYSF